MGIRQLWQGLHAVTAYKVKLDNIIGSNASLPQCILFGIAGNEIMPFRLTATGATVPVVTNADIRCAFLRMNMRVATDLDGVTNPVLRACADQLAGVFTDIFSLSLLYSEVPPWCQRNAKWP